MKSGNFSALSAGIYNPASLQTVNGVLQRTLFAGNIIPTSQISSVGQNVVNLYPNPNTAGTSSSNGLFTSSPIKRDDFDQFTIRVDHRLNDNNPALIRRAISLGVI